LILEDATKEQVGFNSKSEYKYLKNLYNLYGKTNSINTDNEFITFIENNHSLTELEEKLILLNNESSISEKHYDLLIRNLFAAVTPFFTILIALIGAITILKSDNLELNLTLSKLMTNSFGWVYVAWFALSVIFIWGYNHLRRIHMKHKFFCGVLEISIARKKK